MYSLDADNMKTSGAAGGHHEQCQGHAPLPGRQPFAEHQMRIHPAVETRRKAVQLCTYLPCSSRRNAAALMRR